MPATFRTQRSCPYHGGWIRLADCPIVATNALLSSTDDAQSPSQPLSDLLGGIAISSDDPLERVPDGDGATIRLGETIGPDWTSQRPSRAASAGLGRETAGLAFTPGEQLYSRVDGRPRLIVAAPPARPAEVRGKYRRGDEWGESHTPDLPSPAVLAARFGGQRARPVRACPDPSCLHPLPANIDMRDPISIVMVGNSGASKTTTLVALITALKQDGPEGLGVRAFAPSEHTLKQYRNIIASFDEHGQATGTAARTFHMALEFTTELAGRSATVLLHDIAGEDIMDPNRRLRWAPYVLWADAILYVYNPEESPVLNLMEGNADQEGVLNGVLDDLEAEPPKDSTGATRWPKLVVAVSKADLIPRAPDLGAGAVPAKTVKELVRGLGDGGVVNAADRWGDTQWALIAPQPNPPSRRSAGVTDLFRQLLSLVAT